jgi:hypothetical protein
MDLIGMALLGCAFLAGGWLAWRNWRSGRANVRGAWRLAAFLFGCAMLNWAVRVEHSARWSVEMSFLVGGVGMAALQAAGVWVAYLGLEPYVRRRWPWRITSWNRVLEGRLRDPLVGRDVLVGGLVGVAIAVLTHLQAALPGWVGARPAAGILIRLEGLSMPLPFLSWAAAEYVVNALTWFLLLFVLAVLLRRDWLAAAAVLLLGVANWVLPLTDYPAFDAAMTALVVGLGLFVALRFGMWSLVALLFTAGVLRFTPVVADLSTWYRVSTVTNGLAVVAVLAYGFVVSLGSRPLFGKGLLGDE